VSILLIYVIPLLFVVLGIPLVLDLVPPNIYYGFRTTKTLSSPDIWYKINHLLGWGLIVAGITSALVSVGISHYHKGEISRTVAIYYIASNTLPLVVAIVVAWVHLSEL